MNEYLKSILILSVISGIVNSLISSNNSLKKYINYFISLVLVIIILSPVFKICKSFIGIKEYIENFKHSINTEEIIDDSNSIIINSGEESISNGIKNILISKFNFENNDVYVSLNIDKSDIGAIKINSVNIILTNKASWANADTVKEYLENMVGCKINVTRR